MRDPKDIVSLRKRLDLSQSQFARRFGFTLKGLQDYEQGRSTPGGAARVLLSVIAEAPLLVQAVIDKTRGVS
jgi:putative transcriptional regulator